MSPETDIDKEKGNSRPEGKREVVVKLMVDQWARNSTERE